MVEEHYLERRNNESDQRKLGKNEIVSASTPNSQQKQLS